MRGWIEFDQKGAAKGEAYLVAPLILLNAVAVANPELAEILTLLSRTGEGLRTTFSYDPETGFSFAYPFLHDAQRLRAQIGSSNRVSP